MYATTCFCSFLASAAQEWKFPKLILFMLWSSKMLKCPIACFTPSLCVFPPGLQSVGRLTRLTGGSRGGCRTEQRVGGQQTPCQPSQGGGGQQPETDPPGSLRPRGGHGGAAGWVGSGAPLVPATGGWGRKTGAAPPPHAPPEQGPQWGPRCGRTPPPAERPPPSLPEVFSRISAALSSRAPPRRRSPPRARRRPQPRATRTVADMLRARPPPPPAIGGAEEGASLSYDSVAGAPLAVSPSQSTLPPRRRHGRASTEET